MNKFNQLFLKQMNFKKLSNVQEEVLKHAGKKRDIIVKSATGTGKTHAYLFTIGERIDLELEQTQAIIVTPTRELAMQTIDFIKEMQKVDERLNVLLAIGGMDNSRLQKKVNLNPHIVVSTPGKLLDVLSWNLLRLDYVDLLVIDEMDMMFDYGFVEDINTIASNFKKKTNMMLLSATLPTNIRHFINKYLNNPIEITVDEDHKMKPRIDHILINHRHRDINEMLLDLMGTINPLLGLIFTNTKKHASETANFLRSYGVNCVELHGDLTDRRRKQVLREIKNTNVEYIVATDLAARGIDLPEISHVINIGLPSHDLSFYTHRAGRTGRSGRTGFTISLVSNKEEAAIRKLMSQGVEFEYQQISKKSLIPARPFVKTRTRQDSYDPEIQKIVNKKQKKIKPGYKKKRQQQIKRLKNQRRRKKIQEDIKKQKKQRAREKQRELNSKK